MTQAQVAEMLGIDDTTISKYENGKSEPDLQTIEKMAALYKMPMEYFVVSDELKAILPKMLELSDSVSIEQLRMFYKGMELTPDQKRKFVELVRLVFGDPQAP